MRTLIFLSAFLITLGFNSCELIDAPIPIDFPIIPEPIDTIVEPIDTMPEPIVVDTCEAFEEVNTPVYSSWFINMDVPLVDTVFMYGSTPIDHLTFFDTIYYSGQNIGGFKSGPHDYGSNKIWVKDGLSPNELIMFELTLLPPSRAKHYLQFTMQGLNFRGALTFDQYWKELQTHKSAQFLRFSNTGYLCEQIIQVLNFFLEGCYETPDLVDLRPVSIGSCVIPQEIINEYILRGSTVWQ